MSAIKTFYLGTAIKINDIVNLAGADSATVTIEDPSETAKVTDVAMTKLNDCSYQYIYQSKVTDDEGQYKVTVKANYGGYTSLVIGYFTLIED